MGINYRFVDPSTTLQAGEGGGGALDFASDWGTATGTSASAILDGSKWDSSSVPGSNTEAGEFEGTVVSASGLGFPSGMSNVFRSMIYQGAFCNLLIQSSKWSVPAVGEYAYYRVYTRTVGENGGQMGVLHWWHFGGLNDFMAWGADYTTITAGAFNIAWVLNPNGVGASAEDYYARSGSVDTTYRREVRIHRTGTLTATMDVRLYEGDTLLADSSGFLEDYGGGPGDITTHGWTMSTTQQMDRMFQWVQLGANDSVPASGFTDPGYMYLGGFAVRISDSADDWIGAYVAGEAD